MVAECFVCCSTVVREWYELTLVFLQRNYSLYNILQRDKTAIAGRPGIIAHPPTFLLVPRMVKPVELYLCETTNMSNIEDFAQQSGLADYIQMQTTEGSCDVDETILPSALTLHEIEMLRKLLQSTNIPACESVIYKCSSNATVDTMTSEYPQFSESTHAWALFADNPHKRASKVDRFVGTMIIFFQLFTYWIFAAEAIEDYEKGLVAVTTRHTTCLASNQEPQDNFTCEAEFTNNLDAFIAFFMLGIFLAGDVLQVNHVIQNVSSFVPLMFAILAGIEVMAAFVAACISVSYHLYIGEVTDAVAVGVGLLFIRELSQQAYAGIRQGKTKQYKSFFTVLGILTACGMLMDPLCERLFAVKD